MCGLCFPFSQSFTLFFFFFFFFFYCWIFVVGYSFINTHFNLVIQLSLPSFSNIFYSFRHCLAFGWLAFLANRFSSPTVSILWGRITCYFKLNLTTFPYKNTSGDYFRLKDGQNGEKEIYI